MTMLSYHTVFYIVIGAILFGAVIGALFYKYSLDYRIKFSFKLPEDETWHQIAVRRVWNNHEIYADDRLIISEKEGDHIWRSDS